MIKREIKKLQKEVAEMREECRKWEEYNNRENDLIRADIKSKENLIKKYEKILKKKKLHNLKR